MPLWVPAHGCAARFIVEAATWCLSTLPLRTPRHVSNLHSDPDLDAFVLIDLDSLLQDFGLRAVLEIAYPYRSFKLLLDYCEIRLFPHITVYCARCYSYYYRVGSCLDYSAVHLQLHFPVSRGAASVSIGAVVACSLSPARPRQL